MLGFTVVSKKMHSTSSLVTSAFLLNSVVNRHQWMQWRGSVWVKTKWWSVYRYTGVLPMWMPFWLWGQWNTNQQNCRVIHRYWMYRLVWQVINTQVINTHTHTHTHTRTHAHSRIQRERERERERERWVRIHSVVTVTRSVLSGGIASTDRS